jgi:hypothetical protein
MFQPLALSYIVYVPNRRISTGNYVPKLQFGVNPDTFRTGGNNMHECVWLEEFCTE